MVAILKFNLKTYAILFVSSITIHNIEEALFLPSWVNPIGLEVSSSEFTFAVVILTVIAYMSAFLAARSEKHGVWIYIYTGYALAMLVNVFIPHLLTSILLQDYAPGTGTALLLVLPASSLVLYNAFNDGLVDKARFYVTGPMVVLAMAASVPLLFALWRVVSG